MNIYKDKVGFSLLHEWFLLNKGFLGVAESCTGGEVSASIIKFPGASAYFLGGVVAYSNQIKKDFLGVQEKTLRVFGAESFECAQEMAVGVCLRMGANYGVSVTGFAGPGGGALVGCVWIAVQKGTQTLYCEKHRFTGGRREVIEQATLEVFVVLSKFLLDSPKKNFSR